MISSISYVCQKSLKCWNCGTTCLFWCFYLACSSGSFLCRCIWNIKSPPFTYSITRNNLEPRRPQTRTVNQKQCELHVLRFSTGVWWNDMFHHLHGVYSASSYRLSVWKQEWRPTRNGLEDACSNTCFSVCTQSISCRYQEDNVQTTPQTHRVKITRLWSWRQKRDLRECLMTSLKKLEILGVVQGLTELLSQTEATK